MTIPNNPTDRQKLKTMLVEITHCMSRIDGEREQIKEIKKEIKNLFEMTPKMSGKLAKTLYSQSFEDEQAEFEAFEAAYTSLTTSSLQAVK